MDRNTSCQLLSALWLLSVLPVTPVASASETGGIPARNFPEIELPPPLEGLVGMPRTYSKGRGVYLSLITREADKAGLPVAVADAVAQVESGYNQGAMGGVGEVGLMQIRPQTAAMLGYTGGLTGLFEPETNIRLGVMYLARAWQLAKGDLCRALMKYRAGHGEERMTPLSIEYCRRAREHLAAIASPLAAGTAPSDTVRLGSLGPKIGNPGSAKRLAVGHPSNKSEIKGDPFSRELKLARTQARSPHAIRTAADSKRFWAAHETRVKLISAKLNTRMQVAKGI